MKLSKKLRKRRTKKLLTVFVGAIATTGIVAATQLTNFEALTENLSKLGMQRENSAYQLLSDSQDTTANLPTLTNSAKETIGVAAGNNFTAVLKEDGTVWTWGNNNCGQLGNGEIENVSTYELTQVIGVGGEGFLENIKQISVGSNEVYALTRDGKVIAWGRNNYAQLGRGDTQNSGIPEYVLKQVDITDEEGNVTTQEVPLDNIKEIAAGERHALAIDNDGKVWGWGLNHVGQLGLNVAFTTASNVNYKRAYAVKMQKQIEVTQEDSTVTTQLVDFDEAKQVSAGNDFSAVLTNDGKVYCTGLGTSGQIGNNGAANVIIPTQVKDLEDVKKIDAGGSHTLALKDDGTVWAWGLNRYGQLGINTASTTTSNAAYKRIYPVQVLKAAGTPLENITDISAGLETSYAINEEGNAFGWGLNTSGQIGDTTATNRLIATQIMKPAGEAAAGMKLLATGQNTNTFYMVDEKGDIYGNGLSTSYQMLSDRVTNTVTVTRLDETYFKLSHNQAYLEVGSTLDLQVGYHNGLNLLNRRLVPGNVTFRSSNEDIATVSTSGKVTAKAKGYVTIIAEDLSNGYIAESIINVTAKGATALPQVVSGTKSTVYLKEDGTVWASGNGDTGSTGGYNKVINRPVQVRTSINEYLTDIRKIEMGTEHVVALRKDGTVWCWGLGTSGQIGNGASATVQYATQVKNEAGDDYLQDIIDVAAGLDYSLALKQDGIVVGWGVGANHSLGVNSTGNTNKPIKMHDAYHVIQVQGGSDTSTILKGDGTVQAVGLGTSAQLGDNAVTTKAELVYVTNEGANGKLIGVVRIATGAHHTIALKEDKTAWVWGYDNYGQIGMNNTTNYKCPIPLKNVGNTDVMQNIKDIATGPSSSFVLDTNGNVYAVGLNTNGELSIGSKTTVKVFTACKDENGESLTGVATISNSAGTTFGFAFEDGSVGVTGLGTSGQHGNYTLTSTTQMSRIEGAVLEAGNIYETYVNKTTKLNVNIKSLFNLNIDYDKTLQVGELTYKSMDEEIATVSTDGTVIGMKEGSTAILITDTTNEIKTTAYVTVGDRDFSDIYKIVSSGTHVVLLKNDGTVWAWGANNVGQMGNGEIFAKQAEKPEQVSNPEGTGYLTDVIDIASGYNFTIALKRDGTVVAWGENGYGQLGNMSNTAELPVYVQDIYGNKITGVTQVSATRDHAAAVKADGTVWTWGRNDYGQLGNNTTTTSYFAVQVLDSTGKDYLKGIQSVSVGHAYVAALAEDGTVWSWGIGTSGQMGDSGKSNRKLPVQATGVTDAIKIVAGNGTTTILKADGTVWGWGLNRYGQLGYGKSSTSTSSTEYLKTTAIQVKIDADTFLTNVKDIGGILETKFALTEDGTVYGWGLNTTYEIGDDTATNRAYATKPVRRYLATLENKIVKLMSNSGSSNTNFLIREDGSILGNGKATNGQLLEGGSYASRSHIEDVLASYMELTNRIEYVKQGQTKKLEARGVENLNVFAKAPELGKLTWKSTNEAVAVVDQNGNITAKELGQTTIIVTEDKHGYKAQARIYVTANKDDMITAPMVVQGTGFTVTLKADGTVWASGLNNNGALGDGTTQNREELKPVQIDGNTNLTNVVRIAAGNSHALAVTRDGFVYAWGLNGNGQLGINSTTRAVYATKVLDETGEGYLSNIIDVAAGGLHSIAIDNQGNVYTWGKGGNYQLGNYATADKKLPIRVVDTYNIVKAAGGAEFTVLLRGDGIGQGTGLNTNGWLVMGDTTTRYTPLEMGNNTEKVIYQDICDIAIGANHTMILKEDGKVYSAGLNTSGQLATGNATASSLLVPMQTKNEKGELIDLTNIASISAGNATSFAVSKTGEVYSAGLNTSGQLGLGNNTSPVNTFTKVLNVEGEDTLQNITTASTGAGNTNASAFIAKDGTLYTAGDNTNGQLGNGSYFASYLPVIAGNAQLKVANTQMKLKLNGTEQINLSIDNSFNVYNHEKSVGTDLTYEATNPDIATVSNTGVVTGKRLGTTRIKITDKTNKLEKYVPVTVLHSYGYTEAKVGSGINFSVALKEDGTVWAWGNGAGGKIGNGSTANQIDPVPVLAPNGQDPLTKVKDIAVGYDCAFALLEDGTVVGWGNSGGYALGDGTNTARSIPVYVTDTNGDKIQNITKIAHGNDFSLALTKDGEVYSWGYNKYGQLGISAASDTSTPRATKVKEPTGKGTLKGIIDIGCQMYASMALAEDGTVYGWGLNTSGEVGIGHANNVDYPQVTKLSNIDNLVVSAHAGMAIDKDGQLWSWGWNAYGQLSDGTTTNRPTPIKPKLDANTNVTDVIDIGTAGGTHYILDSNYKVYAVGQNGQGQIGDNSTTNRSYFAAVRAKYGEELTDKFVKISTSISRPGSSTDTSTAYLTREDGSVFGLGKNSSYQLFGKNTDVMKAAKEMKTSYLEMTDRISRIKIGETKKLNLNVVENFNIYARTPVTGNITWKSSNEKIATVDQNGTITALAEGQTTITAKDDKYGYVATAIIYVTRNTANTITVPQTAQGQKFTIVLKADGTVWATGQNNVGQCGVNSTVANIGELTPVRTQAGANLNNVVKIVSGLEFTLALTKDGKVYAWGLNNNGQLGINSKVNQIAATYMLDENGENPVTDVIDIAAGDYVSTILKSNGELYAVGNGTYSQLGNGTTATVMTLVKMEEMQNVVQVVGGGYHTIMLKGDSTVWTVGRNRYGELGINTANTSDTATAQGIGIARQVINQDLNGVLRNITQVTAGGYHSVALTDTKEVYSWGYGADGQLGTGKTTTFYYPQTVLSQKPTAEADEGIAGVSQIGSSERSIFFLMENNEVYATGENTNYQLSQNNTTDLLKPSGLYDYTGEKYMDQIANVPTAAKNIYNTAIIKQDGTVWVSGLGANGQVGNGEFQTAKLYTRMGIAKLQVANKIVTLPQGETHTLDVSVNQGFNVYEDASDKAGELEYTSSNTSIATVDENGVVTAGVQGEARITIYDPAHDWTTSALVKVTRDAEDKVKAQVSSGSSIAILKTDGSVWTTGDNGYGQRGVGDKDKHLLETQVLDTNGKDYLTDVVDVSAGQYFIAAVKGDGRVVTWGINNYGQLGNKGSTNSEIPVYVVDSEGNPLTDVLQIYCGYNHTVAVKKDGSVWTWGINNYGQLGDNTATNRNYAVQVKDRSGLGYLQGICQVSANCHNSFALTDTGEVYAWGYNYDGQLGDGTKSTGSTASGRRKILPVKSQITDVARIVVGHSHTIALKNDGTIWAWGFNKYGELGYGASSTSSTNANYCKATPMQVKIDSATFLTNIKEIGTAHESSYAITLDGKVYSWGYNNYGQLGVNNTSNYSYAQLMKEMYGELLTDNIVILNKGTSASTPFMVREDGIILGAGYTGSTQKLLTNRTANMTTVQELRPDFMEVDQRVSYIKQGETSKLNIQIAKNLNAFAGHIKLGNLSWTSSNPEIATVSNDGTITAVALGETTITIKDLDHGYQAQAVVYVIQNNEKAITMPDVSQGENFSVFLKADGSVWTTGFNNNGQCGDGTTTNRSKPVRVKTSSKEYLSDIIKISAGLDHVLALSKTGEVYAWGYNDVGQLGNGSTTRSVFATKVLDDNGQNPMKNVIDISSGYKFSIMLLNDGTVWGVGRNAYGELGILNNTNKSLPVQMDGIANAIRVQANSAGSSIQIANGTVWTTGYNYYGTLGQNGTNTGSSAASQGKNAANPVINNTRNAVLRNVVKLVSGLHHDIVLQEDNTVWAWGYNHVGQYGTGNTTNFAYPVRVQKDGEEISDKIVNVGASGYNTLLQTIDAQNKKHTLITGYNNNGQLGNNTTTNATSFIPLNDKNNETEAENIDILPDDSRSYLHSGFIDTNGTVWTVGLNNYGQLGDDTVYTRKNIVQVGEIALKVEDIVFTMNPNDTKQIKAHIEDSFNVYIKENQVGSLKFESLDSTIAEVSDTGLVTAKGIGDTLIRVIDTDRDIQSAVYVKVIKKQDDMQYEPMVDGGSNHSVALKGDGTVWTWGYNKYGQLGNNSTVTTESPTQVMGKDANGFLTDIQMVASGTNHILALKNDGTVWAWGYNNYGQLGDNTQITRYTPVQVLSEDASEPLQDIIYVAAGTNYSVAVNKKGEVWTWGQNDYGQLGDGTKTAKYTPTRVKANLSGIIKVACGVRHTVALKADGSVYTWGDNGNGQLSDNTNTQRLIPVKVLETVDTYVSDAISISAGNYSTHILKANGTVLSIGLGTSGQLGNNGKVNAKLPVTVVGVGGTDTLTQVREIKSGANTNYALRKDGTVVAWGIGTNGELGNETLNNSLFPVEVVNHNVDGIMGNILYIGAGANHGLAVEDTGYVEVWGLNNQKQVGDITIAKTMHPLYIGSKVVATPSEVTLEVGDTQNLKVAMQSFNLFRATEDEAITRVTYQSLNEAVATVSKGGTITATGMGITTVVVSDSISAKVTTVQVSVLQNGAIATPKVVSGLNHTVALKADGTVWTWGYNAYGQLGDGSTKSSYIPQKIALTDVIDVAAGDYFSMALKKDGSVWVWGYNDHGQLAQGTTAGSLTPVPVKGVNGDPLPKVKKIAACRYQWIALLETGEVVGCGGSSGQGILGDGTTSERHLPVYMLDHNGTSHVKEVKDIAIGYCESFILKEDGTLWSAGHNCNGGMGVGNKTVYSKIRQVQDSTGTGVLNNIIQVSGGGWYGLALDANGNVWATGYNNVGQLGLNNTTSQTRFQKVVGVNGTGYLENIVKIEAGYYNSYAVDKNGNVYGWGSNNNGQLGINNTTNQKVPKLVLNSEASGNLDNVMLVSTGGYHTTFVKSDGTVWATGYNGNGELGNDSTARRLTVECISNPQLEVDQKYLLFSSTIGETKKVQVKASSGFNLLTETLEAGANTYTSLNTSVATVDQNGNITSSGSGTTYIRITNDTLGLTTAVKVVVPNRDGMVVPKVAGGANHYVALKADGTVWTWGLNGSGQLGLGNTTNQLEPTKTNMTDVIDVAAGDNFTAVLKKDGTVWVTGQNNYGQLGQNNTTNVANFIQVKSENGLANLTDIIAITANGYHMAALKSDGSVVAWGYNNYGQLGNNTKTTAKLPTRVRRASNIIDISAGGNYLIMLVADGTVWATGNNSVGQLGQNNTTVSTIPLKMKNPAGTGEMTGIAKVVAANGHTVLLGENGRVYSTGQNNYGQLAQGNTTNKTLIVEAKEVGGAVITNAADIVARNCTTMILRKDGSVYTAGYNGYGAAGNGTTAANKYFTKMLGEYGEGDFTNVLLGANTNNSSLVANNVGSVYTTGYNAYGQLGDRTTKQSNYLVGISHTSLEVKEPIITLQGLGSQKQIESKLNLGFNILYNNLETENYTYKVLDKDIASVDTNGVVTALKYGSTSVEVTNQETGNKAIVILNVVREGDIANPKVASGNDYNVALKSDGTVWTWGYNNYGQLGLGDTTVRAEPTKVNIKDVIDIAVGNSHTLLLKQDGTVWAMGLNNYGQIGNNTTKNVSLPVQVEGLENIIRIEAGANHSIALKSDGTAYSWGYNAYGQLGDNTTTRRSLPVEVRRISSIKAISAGNHSTAALDTDGNVWVWGLNTSGQLGLGTKTNAILPTKLTSVSRIAQIEMGINYGMVVTENGEVYSFGVNDAGQLGIGNKTNQTTPKQVLQQDKTPLTNVETVVAGTKHVLAKTKKRFSLWLGIR